MGSVEIEIPSNKLPEFKLFVERLNKKAARFGTPEILYSIGNPTVKEKTVYVSQKNEEGQTFDVYEQKEKVEVYPVEIHGDLFVVKGWSFIASVEVLESGKSVFHYSPFSLEVSVPSEYRESGHACQHCGHNRQRKHSFILYSRTEDRFIQVGSTCIKDFLGHSASAFQFVANVDEVIRAFEAESFYFGGKPPRVLHVIETLKRACVAIEKGGFISKRKAFDGGGSSTADVVESAGSGFFRGETEKFADKAQAIVEWLRDLDEETLEKNEYLNKLFLLCENEFVGYKNLGILVSAVAAYDRQKQREAEQAKAAQSEFFGEIKKRYDLSLSVQKNITLPDYGYGPSSLLIMFDEGGNCFTWKSSRLLDFKEGEAVALKGTVKDHSVYNGVNQTVLTRCKIL